MKHSKFTIDASSLIKVFRKEMPYYKGHFKTLWLNIYKMIKSEEIISHIEVYKEIMDGDGDDELSKWTKDHKNIFKDYNMPDESDFIKNIGKKFEKFLHQEKMKPYHADPWIVAQAKINNLIVITEESKVRPQGIPNVCRNFKVESIELFDLIKKNNWIF